MYPNFFFEKFSYTSFTQSFITTVFRLFLTLRMDLSIFCCCCCCWLRPEVDTSTDYHSCSGFLILMDCVFTHRTTLFLFTWLFWHSTSRFFGMYQGLSEDRLFNTPQINEVICSDPKRVVHYFLVNSQNSSHSTK